MARLQEQQPMSAVTLSNALIEVHNDILQYDWCCNSTLHGSAAILFSTKASHLIMQPPQHARLCTTVSQPFVICEPITARI